MPIKLDFPKKSPIDEVPGPGATTFFLCLKMRHKSDCKTYQTTFIQVPKVGLPPPFSGDRFSFILRTKEDGAKQSKKYFSNNCVIYSVLPLFSSTKF